MIKDEFKFLIKIEDEDDDFGQDPDQEPDDDTGEDEL